MSPPDALQKRGIRKVVDNVPQQSAVAINPRQFLGFFGPELSAVISKIRARNDAQNSAPPAAAGAE